MILQCPECMARYLVPDSSIKAAGRNVRCAKCSHTWFYKPTRTVDPVLGDLDKLLDEINARPKGLAKGANLPALRGQATLTQKAATITAGLVTVVLALALLHPATLMLAPSKGLILSEVGFAKIGEGEQKTYEITGKISNVTGRIIPVPGLRVTLVDDEGKSLQYWDFGSGTEPPIGPWNKLPFNTDALEAKLSKGTRFVVEIASPLEMALRRKPGPAPTPPAEEAPPATTPAVGS